MRRPSVRAIQCGENAQREPTIPHNYEANPNNDVGGQQLRTRVAEDAPLRNVFTEEQASCVHKEDAVLRGLGCHGAIEKKMRRARRRHMPLLPAILAELYISLVDERCLQYLQTLLTTLIILHLYSEQ